jgi:hypothetical protein
MGQLALFCAELLLLNKSIKIIAKYVAGPLVFCVLAWSIYKQIQRQDSWDQSLRSLRGAMHDAESWKLWAVVLLMLLNWGIEARKWQLVIGRIQKISFLRAYMATFTGTTLAFFTPNRVGEYLGRILYISKGKRIQAISLTIVTSIAQLMITVSMGIAGLFYLKHYLSLHPSSMESLQMWISFVLVLALILAVILTLFYFRLSWFIRLFGKIPALLRYRRFIKVLEQFNATILLRILSLSLFRYFVFIVQYYLLFRIFSVDISWWQAFWAVSVMFLVLAMAPTFAFLTELGVRAKASIELVQIFSSNMMGILASSLTIWIINLVIPALIGSLLILGIKIKSSGLMNGGKNIRFEDPSS